MSSIAIIGAGPSGLAAAKSALECGLSPTVLEKSSSVGGLWKPETGSVWDSMRTNISHHTCTFSDYCWPDSAEDFPTQKAVYTYLESYAKHFNLLSHVHLKSEVKKVRKAEEKWSVTWIHNDQEKTAQFDFVLVCSGIFSKAFIPNIPLLDQFRKPILHASEYKTPLEFKGKHVAVIGNAFSGCEIASELSQVAARVTHVFRRSNWVLPRYLKMTPDAKRAIPLDLVFYSRVGAARSIGVEPAVANEKKHAWFNGLTKQAEVSPELEVGSPTSPPFVAISDGYLTRVKEKAIELKKGNIKQFDQEKIEFEDGSSVTVDAAIFCTGYQTVLPFLDEGVLKTIGYKADDQLQPLLLHKTVFHPDLPNFGFVGLYRGPYFGVIELQARWACMVFSRKAPMPSKEEMQKGIEGELQIRNAQPRLQFPHGDYVLFSDDIAKQIGALPQWERLKQEDPSFHKKLWDGPFTAGSYRLDGFGANPETAITLVERINQATNP